MNEAPHIVAIIVSGIIWIAVLCIIVKVAWEIE